MTLCNVTNGTRLVGRAEDLVRSGLLAVGLSIDPPGPNDRYRGNGTFAICGRKPRAFRRLLRHGQRLPFCERRPA